MRRLAWFIAIVTALGAGGYTLVSILRWEWHRAIVFALVFVAVEVGLGIAWLYRAVGPDEEPPEHRDVPQRGRPHQFDWLDAPGDRFGVFIPLLLGSGVIISAVAKVVERVASSTGDSDPSGLHRPAGYAPIAFPPADLVPSDEVVRATGLPTDDDAQLRRLLGPFAVADRGRRRDP